MTDKTEAYRRGLIAALECRDRGDEDGEEAHMSELDTIWLSMTAEEVEQTKIISSELSSKPQVRWTGMPT